MPQAGESEHDAFDGVQGGPRALLAGMDSAVHQSGVPGSRALVARRRRTRGALQQLRRAATQCTAAHRSAAQAKAASSHRLSAAAPRALAAASRLGFVFDPQNCIWWTGRELDSPHRAAPSFAGGLCWRRSFGLCRASPREANRQRHSKLIACFSTDINDFHVFFVHRPKKFEYQLFRRMDFFFSHYLGEIHMLPDDAPFDVRFP
jgi:hypothetical protein